MSGFRATGDRMKPIVTLSHLLEYRGEQLFKIYNKRSCSFKTFNCGSISYSISNSEVQGQTDLRWAPAAPCQTCGSVNGAWLCSGTATPSPHALGDRRSEAAPLCSTSETEAPPTRPLMTALSPLAGRGSSRGWWRSWRQKQARSRKRSRYPEIGGEGRDTEREGW